MAESDKKEVISVIGLGYVGLTTAVGFGLKGHKVIGIDVDEEKVRRISERTCPLHEDGLDEALRKVNITATTDYRQILDSDVSFLCVNTPSNSDSSIDLTCLKNSVEQLAGVLRERKAYHLVVVRSTVVPGTTEEVIIPVLKNSGHIGICVNPEFFRQGKALHDFLNSSRIVIGENGRAADTLYHMYQSFGRPILRTDIWTAEMIKYASNAFLATKISFINEIGNICKKLGIDVYEVARGMGYDPRIGDTFLNAGVGFGGSCLPKDVAGLVARSKEIGYNPRLLEEVCRLNDEQSIRMLELVKKHIPSLKGATVGILGLAFKPGTDDIRESRAIVIVRALLEEGARVKVYDPKAMPNFYRLFPEIEYTSPEEVLASDATLILTEWDEFNSLDYRNAVVIDGRRVTKAKEARVYEGICW